MTQEIHVDDVGTIMRWVVYRGSVLADDLGSAISIDINVRKPDLSTATWTGSLETDGSDGVVTYTIQAGDFDQAGQWAAQVVVTYPLGVFHSDFDIFMVYANL